MDRVDFSRISKLDSEILIKEFKTNLQNGLGQKDATQRLVNYGPNEIILKKSRWYHILLRQFKSPFIYLLLGAAILAFVLKEMTDGIMILIFIFINAILGFSQEYKSEKTLELLKKYSASLVKAIRDGKEELVKSRDLVPGDIIKLVTGDKVPADVRFLETYDLGLNESVLTGESISVKKGVEINEEFSNMAFSSTSIVSGSAKALVLFTGKKTRMGDITSLAVETKRVSNFEKGIARFSSFILKLVSITLVAMLVANILIKGREANIVELIIFSIALAVSVIPEALPVVMTFSLSKGALQLARKKVVVRRLSAIEDLGGIQVLCSDKTGTLTENELTVANYYNPQNNNLILYSNLGTTSISKDKIEPFDIALWSEMDKKNESDYDKYKRISECPFDPKRKINSVLVSSSGKYELISRGAPEVIFQICKISKQEVTNINNWIKAEGILGHRVLAIAKKKVVFSKKQDIKYYEKNLEFLGVISFVDPIKSTTVSAVKQAEELGVKIKIITGDSREVSGAVGKKVGLLKNPEDVISGEEFDELDQKGQLEAIDKYSVFCRISPEQKFHIIELLQSKYQVGFLGEGINDAPALKLAGVSIVVQSASDISRENADIVLLKKNLKVIVDGIKEGREIFANTTKYIKTTLASNFGNFYSVAIASLFIKYLPMLPIQILLLNLLSDFPMIAIANDSVDSSEVKKPRFYDIREMMLFCTVLGIVSSLSDFIVFAFFFHYPAQVLQTNWFISSILTEIVFIFSIRSRGLFLKAKFPAFSMIILSLVATFLTVLIPFTRLGHSLFKFISPSFNHLMIILGVVILEFVSSEFVKIAYYKYIDKKNNLTARTAS